MFNLFLNQQTVVLIVSFIEIAAPLLSTNACGTQTSSRLCVVKLGEREETRQPQAALNGVTLTQRMTLHSSAPPHFFCCRVPRTSSTHAECHSRRMTGFTNAVPFPLSTDLAVKNRLSSSRPAGLCRGPFLSSRSENPSPTHIRSVALSQEQASVPLSVFL